MKIITSKPECVWKSKALPGEGTLWVKSLNSIFFVDIKNKKIFKKFYKLDGVPDDMTIDKFKNLWVCHFGGSCISVFNKKGKKIHKINLPAKNVTNCTFGGKNNTDLFISTARKSMNKIDLQKFRFSRSLFKVKINIKGIDSKRFNYSE